MSRQYLALLLLLTVLFAAAVALALPQPINPYHFAIGTLVGAATIGVGLGVARRFGKGAPLLEKLTAGKLASRTSARLQLRSPQALHWAPRCWQ